MYSRSVSTPISERSIRFTAIVYAGLMPESVGSGQANSVAVGEGVGRRDRRVVEAEHLALVAQELAYEREDPDAALAAQHDVERARRGCRRGCVRIRVRSFAGSDAPRVRNDA